MLYDKLLLKFKSNYILKIKKENFDISFNKFKDFIRYKQLHPFSLAISIDNALNVVLIEFTSKILKDGYSSLINRDNIRDCFIQIQNLGICDLDIDGILNDSIVLKCDVTMDVPFDISRFPSLIADIKQSLRNYDRWHCDPYSNRGGVNGAVIYNTAVNAKHKRRMVIYDKATELRRADNNDFIRWITDPQRLMNYYDGKVRFELNLHTMSQVRDALNISDNRLMSVLTAETNPIADFIERAIVETALPSRRLSQRTRERIAFITSHGNDLRRVEAAIRETKPKSVAISRAMKPYREAFAIMEHRPSIRQTLLEMVA